MITIEERIINVYYVLDEELKKLNHASHKNSKFTDAEIVTLGISKELIEKGTDKDFYNLIKENYLYLFPKLPDYSKFILRIKKLVKLMNVLFERLFCNDVSDGFVDTMPIEMIMGVREKKSKVSKAFYRYGIKPDWGHCESKKIKYFGFKLIGIYSDGLLKNFMLVSARSSEQGCLMKFVKEKNVNSCNLFGDKGFQMNADDIEELKDRNINLEIPSKKNLKNPPKVEDLYHKIRARRQIETAFGQLNDTFKINSFVVRSVLGFTVSILRKIFAFNLSKLFSKNLN